MPIKNLWSLEPGECLVAEELTKRLKDCRVYFPLHDKGIDLLLTKGKKHVGIQVKESRYYTWANKDASDPINGSSWHQIHQRKLQRDLESVDFYVFVTYVPKYGKHKFGSFENKFLIVPTKELEKKVAVKNPGKSGIYHFYFHFAENRVVEIRGKIAEKELVKFRTSRDYSEFSDAWHLIGL